MSNSGELTINNPAIGETVTDGTIMWTVSKDLSLSGGIIKGQFYTANSYDFVDIMAGPKGTYSGASLHLLGKDFGKGYDGFFQLSAIDSPINIIKLEGGPDRSLTWANNDLAGSAIAAKNLATNGYIKYASELLIQWGRLFIPVNTNNANNILPISFNSKAIGVGNIAYVDGNESSTVRAINIDVLFNNKTIKTVLESVEHTGDVYVNYITIGY